MESRNVSPEDEKTSQLIRAAFGSNPGVALDYNSDFVRSAFEYPGVDVALSPAFYEGDVLVSLMASLPRHVTIGGRHLQIALLTWNSVDPAFRRQGLGVRNVGEATRRARAAGYDGVLLYCLDGSIANKTTVAGVRSAGVECERVFTIEYSMGLIPKIPLEDGEQFGLDERIETFLRLSRSLSPAPDFCRVFDRREAEWECGLRYGAVTEMSRAESRSGMLTGYILADAGHNPLLFIESVLWGDLFEEERITLARRFLARAAGRASTAILPLLGYADPEPFRALRFRKTTRKLHAYVSVWSGEQPESCASI
jgi:hypothetical protein